MMAKVLGIEIKILLVYLFMTLTALVNSLDVDLWCPSACRCKQKDLMVDCSHAALTIIPPNIPSETVTLDLSGNPLGILDSLPSLGRLRVLYIQHSLSELPSNSLRLLKSLRKLDLSNNFFKDISPDIVPPSLDTLILARNSLLRFDNSTEPILRSSSLRTLDLSHCYINRLEPQAFTALRSLKYLDLSNNYLQTLHPDLFSPLSALISLNLSYNLLAPITNTMFQNNPFLTFLNLSGNLLADLRILPRNTSTLQFSDAYAEKQNAPFLISPNLEHLDLSECMISQLTAEFLSYIPMLRYLSLAYAGIRRLDWRSFSKLTNLETLDLSGNEFYYVTEHLFKNNHKLASLTCSPCSFSLFSRFSARSESTIQSASITYLNFEDTKVITTLNYLGAFPALKTLLLSHTKISSISATAFSLNPQLTEVHLSYCEIDRILPNTFISNQNLSTIKLNRNELGAYLSSDTCFPTTTAIHIDLSDCVYENIPKKYFSSIPSVWHLNLSGNPLRGWEEGAFADLRSLKSLDLSRTLLTRIDPNSFISNSFMKSLFLSSLRLGGIIYANSFANRSDASSSTYLINIPTLKELDLSNCGIQYLTSGIFSGVPSLQKLSLSDNELRMLDANFIKKDLLNLTFLDLQNNPWRCDCQLADLRDWWFEQKMKPLRHWVICEEPDEFRDHAWDVINNCGSSVSNINKNFSNNDISKEAETLNKSSTEVDVKLDVKTNKSENNETSSTIATHLIGMIKNSSSTDMEQAKKSSTEAVKITSVPPMVTKTHDDVKHSHLHFHRFYPPKPLSPNSSNISSITKGALGGFFGVVLILLLASLLYILVRYKRYKRIDDNTSSETIGAWEL